MSDMHPARFEAGDLNDELPRPGFYASEVINARFRKSEAGNAMLQVVHAIAGGTPGHDRVAEYFILAGGSARGRALSRKRLVELYRACGLEPRAGEPIEPSDLIDARLEVHVEHELWQGRPRLRVTAHRRANSGEAPF
jgi:hypothetical protein